MVESRSFLIFFFSSRRRHTRCLSDWSSGHVLFRSGTAWAMLECVCTEQTAMGRLAEAMAQHTHPAVNRTPELYRQIRDAWEWIEGPDRKSTRLKSSHLGISYAV